MAESSKRTWPWKKKAQDKAASSPESIDSSPRASPHNSKFFDEQDVSKILSDHARVSDEAMTQWQHSESKLKQLSDKLNAAQTELTTKEILVKQHAKVAEEAVTGWERAEAEAAALKQQLDTTIHQKLATEDRVSHLDGALKECMRQLRHVREEQEQRIHETMVKKTREYDKLRQEMEAKLAEVGHNLQDARSDAIESRGEAHAMSNALQERTKALAEVQDAKARVDTEVKLLQVRLESMEKDKSAFKYELQVLRKELEIRNEEREYERKAAEIAGKKQLDNVKKIAHLEAECQRLRNLVRKKLPGPAALAQMKIEVDSLSGGNNGFDPKRRRSLGVSRSVSSSPKSLDFSVEPPHDNFQDSNGGNREAEALAEKLVEMEDELKMLKEALAKRDQELQASRLMCAKTASKLSNVEEQLGAALKRSKRRSSSKAPSQKEGSRNGSESVDAWNATSALLAELDQFSATSKKGLDVGQLDLMDDFAEIEMLAMATEKVELEDQEEHEASEKSFSEVAAAFEEKLLAKEKELEEANSLCKEVSQQLARAEDQLAVLQSRNSSNEAALVTLQEKLDRICDKQNDYDDKDRNITKELEDLVEAQSISSRAGVANEAVLYDTKEGSQNGGEVQNGVRRSVSSRSSFDVRYEASEDLASVLSDAESKGSTRTPDLVNAIRRLVHTVETLAQATGSEHELSIPESRHEGGPVSERQVCASMQWKDSELEGSMQSLIGISSKLLLGETDTVEFLSELTAVLSCLVVVCTRNLDHLVERIESQADGANVKGIEDDLRKIRLEKAALESHMRAEMSRVGSLEEDLNKARREKVDVEKNLEVTNKRLEGMLTQLQEAQKFTDVDRSNGHKEGELRGLSVSKTDLDIDRLLLHKKVAVLVEGEMQGERRRHQEMLAKYLDLQQQIHAGASRNDSLAGSPMREGSEWGGSHNRHQSLDSGEIRVRKEQDIQSAAEKLAECQRSILDLGKQLKALSSPRDSLDVSYESDTASSGDRVTHNSDPSSDHNSSQLLAEDTHSVSNMISDLHERAPSGGSGEDITPWSTPRGNSVPTSPFLDRRRSPSPPSIPRTVGQNGNHYPPFSYGIRSMSERKQNGFGNGTGGPHVGGSITVAASPAASEFSLLGSLSVPCSPARSPATVLPSRPHSVRTDFSRSNGGHAAKDIDADSYTTSFSRFYARTKSGTAS